MICINQKHPLMKRLQVYFSAKQSCFFSLFLHVSLSLPTSNRRPAVPGPVKSHLWFVGFFYCSPATSEKSRGGPFSPQARMSMGTRCLKVPPPVLAIVTHNLPLARVSDSSGCQVQAEVSQGHIGPPSVLICLFPSLPSGHRGVGRFPQ